MNSPLPAASGLDIAALSRLFSKTTNSYKYVFFISYLDILKRRNFDASEPISFREMSVEMLATSWYPHIYFRLSFGLQDKINEKLDALNLEIGTPILKFRDHDKRLLRTTISQQTLDDSLMQYVPYRILRPFFEDELRGLKDCLVDPAIARLAAEKFAHRNPLYKFNRNRDQLIPHSGWVDYFKAHYAIIKGWTAWNWLEYMQQCNPGVPAISAKLFPPPGRLPLNSQTSFWKIALRHGSLKCIYSGEPLQAGRFSLDHYLPWSFIAHDHLWNLIPTSREVNSSKSDCLPSQSYFDSFVNLQHQGLVITSQQIGERKWEKYIEPYIADLKISNKLDLLDQHKLRLAYESNLLPLLELAKSVGFSPNWRFRPPSSHA